MGQILLIFRILGYEVPVPRNFHHSILHYSILSYIVLSYPVLSCSVLHYSIILSYSILSYPILFYPILSYLILSYLVLSYPLLSCSVLLKENIINNKRGITVWFAVVFRRCLETNRQLTGFLWIKHSNTTCTFHFSCCTVFTSCIQHLNCTLIF